MSDEMTLKLVNESGEEITCDILFTFEDENTNNHYVVYTDNSLDDEGNVRVFAAIYDPEVDGSRLYPITTDDEWNTIEFLLDKLQKEAVNSANNEEKKDSFSE